MIKVRFAPSPTGYLHIGGARTALFNWLFAKHHQGKFLLRIEDTDRQRSTKEAIDAIFESMQWLGLHHDGEVVYQAKNVDRHLAVAEALIQKGAAYYCTCTSEEVEAMREDARAKGLPPKYNGKNRDTNLSKQAGAVIRFKSPLSGETVIDDMVQGTVTIQNDQFDDLILVRADGTPTYMLSVVVDDHDMGITHILRGDDHLTNAFRQKLIYTALNWDVPQFGHIPLIHGNDGKKLSKRHGALGAEAYRDMGILPEAMRNYLLRLGWSHGDDEVISTKQAIEWFDGTHIGKSPARFDSEKLLNLNGVYIRNTDDKNLLQHISPMLKQNLDYCDSHSTQILSAMPGLKERAKTINELTDNAQFIINRPDLDQKSQSFLNDEKINLIPEILKTLESLDFQHDVLQESLRTLSKKLDIKLGPIMGVVRVAITGRTVSPSMFEIMEILGKDECINRIKSLQIK